MAYDLLKVMSERWLDFEWFPTPAQCVIYRNWGTVSPRKLAKVLKTDVNTILQMAEDMGLDPGEEVSEQWQTRGYITIIRNNWHLLGYEELCILLDWSLDYLAFMLKEDDFLGIKLGKFKPKTPCLNIEPLTEEQINRTMEIKEITLDLRKRLPKPVAKPFEFFDNDVVNVKVMYGEQKACFGERIIYSYCALFGDTFFDKSLIDMSFPDAMLMQYQSVGINGIWTQAVLSKLAPFPFDLSVSEGYEKRLDGIRYLTDKLEKFGIKLYLYFNEPRAMNDSFYEKYPELMGHTQHPRFEGIHSLCMSTEPVRKYLHDGIAYVVKNVPKLGGLYTITASENLTHCHSHTKNAECSCPRCREKSREEMIALVNKTIFEGARSVNPDIKMFAHSWAWQQPEMVKKVAEELPEDVGICIVSEYDVHKEIRGVETKVIDYSISVDGPGVAAKEVWDYAKKEGREAYAKVQVNNTWELSTVPFIPVFDKVYNHLKKIKETRHVDHLVLSWTLGGYPSPMLEMVREFAACKEKTPSLTEIYQKIFPGTDQELLAYAFRAFSEAFHEFPFSATVIYYAPLQVGPANLLYKEKTGFAATMVGYPYDDLTKWRHIYPENVFYDSLDALCIKWKKGLEYLDEILVGDDQKLQLVVDCAKACYLHYSSVKNQVKYLMEGTTDDEKRIVLESEEKIAEQMAELVGRNAAFGFEAADHYYYTRQNLFEKIINCRYLCENL